MSDTDTTIFDDVPERPTSFRDIVYQQLKTAIITGRLKPGIRLVESKIASMLNVSRTPLREAIGILEQEGYLERLATGGVRVPQLLLEELQQLNQVRVALERLVAQQAALRINEARLTEEDEDLLAELDAALDEFDRVADEDQPLEVLRSGKNLHQLIHKLSGNEICARLLDQIMGMMERYRALVPVARNKVIARQHRDIVAAIKRGDDERAVELMTTHLEEAGALYAETIAELEARQGGEEADGETR